MIMFAHSAASLMPFMQQTWAEETNDSDACLLKHRGVYNTMMAYRFEGVTDSV